MPLEKHFETTSEMSSQSELRDSFESGGLAEFSGQSDSAARAARGGPVRFGAAGGKIVVLTPAVVFVDPSEPRLSVPSCTRGLLSRCAAAHPINATTDTHMSSRPDGRAQV